MRKNRTPFVAAALLLGAGCGSDPGDVTLVLEAEASIQDGIASGSDNEDIVDGWSVEFDKYIVSLGAITLARSSSGASLSDATTRVIDLVTVPGGSATVTRFTDAASGRWDLFEYGLVAPTAQATRDPGVSVSDFDEMVAGGCTYLIDGRLVDAEGNGTSTPPGGEPRSSVSTIAFRFCVPAVVSFTNCENEAGRPGIAVPSGGEAIAGMTFHGDHIFFTAFPEGAEIISRRAQWLADSDVNGDGTVTRTELESLDAGDELAALYPSALGWSLASGPLTVDSAWTFLRAQLMTQGHFQGEGECFVQLPTP